jgi:hypothetical protein
VPQDNHKRAVPGNKKRGVPMDFRAYEEVRDGLIGGKMLGVLPFLGAVFTWVVLTLFVGFIFAQVGMMNKTPVMLIFVPIIFLIPLWLVKKAGGLVTRPLKQIEPVLIVISIMGIVLYILLFVCYFSGIKLKFW